MFSPKPSLLFLIKLKPQNEYLICQLVCVTGIVFYFHTLKYFKVICKVEETNLNLSGTTLSKPF